MDAQSLLDCKTVVTVGKGHIGQVYSCMAPPCSPAQDVDESPYGRVVPLGVASSWMGRAGSRCCWKRSCRAGLPRLMLAFCAHATADHKVCACTPGICNVASQTKHDGLHMIVHAPDSKTRILLTA